MSTRFGLWGVLLLVMLLASASGCGSPAASLPPGITAETVTLAIKNGILIDGTGADPVANVVVLIADNTILAVGPSSKVNIPQGVRTIDARGGAILPGFINAHVHRGFNKDKLQAWAYGGVTTVRDETASTEQIAQLKTLRDEIGKDPNYARLISAGTMLAVPGGYGDLFVSSPREAKKVVLSEIDKGVDAIKVALEDGYAGKHDLPKLTPEELKAIVSTAHAHDLPVSGHITQGAYLQPMLEAGVDDIAHLPADFISPDSLQQMVQQGIYLTPTFTVFRNYGAPVETMRENLRQFVELGGQVALGNDYGGGPGVFEPGIPMYEIEMMEEAGMTPMHVIVACTLNGAHVLRIDQTVGSLVPGKDADILIVGGNPLEDLHTLAGVKVVIHAGVVIRNDLQE